MADDTKFHHRSYLRHQEVWLDFARGGAKEEHAKTWLQDDTVDAWRHHRMYAALDPLLEMYPESRWLTVGDGRYGKDAHYLMSQGIKDVLATDISDALLTEASEMGFIEKFKKENAETLSFGDEAFDFVFCKESYHHFPRPMLALYEMIRVSRLGVVLIEPNDHWIKPTVTRKTPQQALEKIKENAKYLVKWLLGRTGDQAAPAVQHGFEEGGNYAYAISRREMEKVAAGLKFPLVAFKGINDHYLKGVEFEKAADNGELFREVKKIIEMKDRYCQGQVCDYDLLVAIIFKERPAAGVTDRLRTAGFDVVEIPENPYL